MPWNGSGVYTRTNGFFIGATVWAQDKAAAVKIVATRHDTADQDIATALNNCLTLDAQNTANAINLVTTSTSSLGVINIGGINFANLKGNFNSYGGGAGNFTFVSGASNTGFGQVALSLINSGGSNTAFGFAAIANLTSGSSNTAVGNDALLGLLTGSNNAALGNLAGFNVTGGDNTLLGQNAGGLLTSGSSNIAVGSNCDLPSITANGQINIGCTIFGTGCTGTGSTNGTGAIGINTNNPQHTLDVNGDLGTPSLKITEGANRKQNVVTLIAGSKVVANTSVTATSRIFLTSQTDGGTPGWLRVSSRIPGTSFTITSSSASDVSIVAYLFTEPA